MNLADAPDVLTDADLMALLRLSKWQFQRLVMAGNRTGVSLLPRAIPHLRRRRYLRADVEQWLRTGGASSRHLRRVAS